MKGGGLLLWIELSNPPPRSYAELPASRTTECASIWKEGLYRDNQVKMRSLGWALKQYVFIKRENALQKRRGDPGDASTNWGTAKMPAKKQKVGERPGADAPSQPPEGAAPHTPWATVCSCCNFCQHHLLSSDPEGHRPSQSPVGSLSSPSWGNRQRGPASLRLLRQRRPGPEPCGAPT